LPVDADAGILFPAPEEQSVKAVILTEGKLGVFTSKTAACVIRYRRDEVVAVIDSTKAGSDAGEHLGIGAGIPVVASVAETLEFKPDTLIIGIAPPGGGLPDEFRKHILDATGAGLRVLSGLHVFLSEDPEIGRAAAEAGVELVDLRKVPADIPLGTNLAKDAKCLRVLTVGTDCNVGKMVAAWEIAGALRAKGRDAKFLATGQTGIILAGGGLAIDRVISDFVSGAAQKMILDNQEHEILVIEGQGALQHPSYSGVTVSMLHGYAPQAIVLVHHATRKLVNHYTIPIWPLARHVKIYEELAEMINPAKVVGIVLNCADMSEEEARRAVAEAEEETGLPVTDVIRFGAGKIVAALEEML
jgi:uncharacterized NAD-dependent epimerase/dehydratase family protein